MVFLFEYNFIYHKSRYLSRFYKIILKKNNYIKVNSMILTF